MTLQDQAKRIGEVTKKHAPEILTAISVGGLAGTAYLAGRAGFKSGLVVMAETAARMDEAEEGADVSPLTAKEIVKETWKFYIPVTVVAVVTGVAIIGSHRISQNQRLALISAAAIAEKAHREYQDKVVEHTSKAKERKIRDDVAQDTVNEKATEIDKLVLNKDGDVYVLETHTKNVFVSNAQKIHKAENDANRVSNQEGYISLNTFLEFLGLPTSDAGEVVGWSNDKPLEVVIGGANRNDQPVLTINYRYPPTVTYKNPW
jgi:hypothetical protein